MREYTSGYVFEESTLGPNNAYAWPHTLSINICVNYPICCAFAGIKGFAKAG
jgi:hypothetical protein